MNRTPLVTAGLAVFMLLAVSVFAQDSDKQRDTLKYGLEDEIVELVNTLQENDDTRLNTELESLFSRTRSNAVRESILSFYAKQENKAFQEYSLGILEDPFEHSNKTVTAVLQYIEKVRITEAAPAVRKILEYESDEFRDKAIRTLGKIGSSEDAAYLFDYMNGSIPGDEKTRLIIRQNVMSALGDLKSTESWDEFVSIAQDEDENTMIRATAVRALGAIGNEGGSEIIAALFESSDPILRASVVTAIGDYSDQTAVDVVLEGLKDTHYKVRLEALDAVEKQKKAEAAPYVQYRAENDPVDAVKLRAINVLAVLGEYKSVTWMLEKLNEEKTPDKTKMRIITALLENDPNAVLDDAVAIAFESLKDDKKTWIRYELGKAFAKHDNTRLSEVAEAYLLHKDTVTKSLGIEMFNKNHYGNLKEKVEEIAENEKMGGLQKQAQRALENQ